ncbi:MAG: TetR/AcrR family transcriptional regulator [Actinobacteria bacterium]|nr:TetR/AcrR family transcriptional regulator [Actinomycetota bacterium]
MTEDRAATSGTRRRLGRPPASRAAATRARILNAARVCFAEQGYGATTNRAIAEGAGITTGAIYHYFASKQELYESVLVEVEDIVSAQLEAVRDAAVPTTTAQVRAVLEQSVALNREDSSLARFLVTVPTDVRRHAELSPLLGQLARYNERLLGPIVDGALRREEVAAGVSRATLLGMLGVILAGLVEVSANLTTPDQHARNTEAVLALLEGHLFEPVGAPSAGA